MTFLFTNTRIFDIPDFLFLLCMQIFAVGFTDFFSFLQVVQIAIFQDVLIGTSKDSSPRIPRKNSRISWQINATQI